MVNYSFFKSRSHLVLVLLKSLSFLKWKVFLTNLISYLFKREKSGHIPSILTINLTYRCNYSCIMCQKSSNDKTVYSDNPKDMDFNQLEILLRDNARHISIVKLHGGEPLYYKKIIPLIKLLNELKLKYSLITNGYLMNEEISNLLLENCLYITVSIDSVNPEQYKFIRRGGDLNTVTKNIQYLNSIKRKRKKRTPFLNLAATMFTFNLPGLENLVEYCSKNKIPSMSISEGTFYNTPYIDEKDFIKNDIKKVEQYVTEAQNLADKLGIVLRFNSPILYWNKRENSLINNRSRITSCFNYYFAASINPQFKLSLCALSYPVGQVSTEKLSEVWNKKDGKIVAGRKLINNKNEFPKSCRYCNDYNKSLQNGQGDYSYIDLQKKHSYWKISNQE